MFRYCLTATATVLRFHGWFISQPENGDRNGASVSSTNGCGGTLEITDWSLHPDLMNLPVMPKMIFGRACHSLSSSAVPSKQCRWYFKSAKLLFMMLRARLAASPLPWSQQCKMTGKWRLRAITSMSINARSWHSLKLILHCLGVLHGLQLHREV